ncbi:hypothetical protein EV361DRAFT_874989, partial [Lentinula raphanica]
ELKPQRYPPAQTKTHATMILHLRLVKISRGYFGHWESVQLQMFKIQRNGKRKEGDAISWFQSEANMYRWLEEFESKHCKFHRYIRTCRRLLEIWTMVADETNNIEEAAEIEVHKQALQARALRQAAIFNDLETLALNSFGEVAHPDFFDMSSDLVPRIEIFHREQLKWMGDLDIIRSDLVRVKLLAYINDTHSSLGIWPSSSWNIF